MNETYYESTLSKENRIEYVDSLYLSKYCLNNKENALNYFYTSPFYTSRSSNALNEKIRTGKLVDEDDEGYLFKISYDNLKVLKKEEPSDPIASHIYYNTNAIFHISMTYIYKLKGNICKKVVQFFCIFNGKIYSSISLGQLLTSKINHIVKNIEKFFDAVNEMVNFNITSNYYFENKKFKELDPIYENYKLNDMEINTVDEQKPNTNEKEEEQKNTAHMFYTRNVYDVASRIANEELIYKSLNKNNQISKQQKKNI